MSLIFSLRHCIVWCEKIWNFAWKVYNLWSRFFSISNNIRSFLAFEASTSPFQCLAINSYYQAHQVSTTKEVNNAKIKIHRDEFQQIILLQYWTSKGKTHTTENREKLWLIFEAGINLLNRSVKNYPSIQLRLAISFLWSSISPSDCAAVQICWEKKIKNYRE